MMKKLATTIPAIVGISLLTSGSGVLAGVHAKLYNISGFTLRVKTVAVHEGPSPSVDDPGTTAQIHWVENNTEFRFDAGKRQASATVKFEIEGLGQGQTPAFSFSGSCLNSLVDGERQARIVLNGDRFQWEPMPVDFALSERHQLTLVPKGRAGDVAQLEREIHRDVCRDAMADAALGSGTGEDCCCHIQ